MSAATPLLGCWGWTAGWVMTPYVCGLAPTQEIFDNGLDIDPETVVHVWKWWWPVSGSALASRQAQNGSTNSSSSSRGVSALSGGDSSSRGSRGESALSGGDSSATEGGGAAAGRPRVCQLARGCVPAQAELDAEVAPGWTNAIAGVTRKVPHLALD